MDRYSRILSSPEEMKSQNQIETLMQIGSTESLGSQKTKAQSQNAVVTGIDPHDPNPTGPNAKIWAHLLYIAYHFQLYHESNPQIIADNTKNKNIYPLLKSLRTAGADVIVTDSEFGYKLLPGKIPQNEWDTEIRPRWLAPNHQSLTQCLKEAKRVAELKLLAGGGVDRPEMVSEAEAAFAGPDAGPGGAAGSVAGGNGAEKRQIGRAHV